jgi:hypothetical protein
MKEINFFLKEDFIQFSQDIFDNTNLVKPLKINNFDEAVLTLLKFNHRSISPAKREIRRSKTFSCPVNVSDGLILLENKILNGNNLDPHQSRCLAEPKDKKFNDLLLFDWDIYHLHLGLRVETDGFIERTDDLLFAVIKDDVIYELTVQPHGIWTDLDLLECINQNWPQLLFFAKINGTLSHSSTSDDLKILRKKCINSLLTLSDGTSYFPPGFGYQSDGTSSKVILRANRFIRTVNKILDDIDSSKDQLLDAVSVHDSPLEAHLEYDDANGFRAYIMNLNKKAICFSQWFQI